MRASIVMRTGWSHNKWEKQESAASRVSRVARCGVVRCEAVRCGEVRCGAVRCGAVQASERSTNRAVRSHRRRHRNNRQRPAANNKVWSNMAQSGQHHDDAWLGRAGSLALLVSEGSLEAHSPHTIKTPLQFDHRNHPHIRSTTRMSVATRDERS
jgi:hypothetical protein